MMNPIIKSLIKSYQPLIKENIKSAEKSIVDYLAKIPLQGEETHIAIFSEIEEGKVFIVVGAFVDRTFARVIQIEPFEEFLNSLLQKLL